MTLVRFLLTPFIVAAIVRGEHGLAVLLFAAAAFTDYLDGQLARTWKIATTVGQYLDPIADKVLLSSVFVALGVSGSVPVWYVSLVLGRDLVILAASAIAMKVSRYRDYTPTIWGKISTVFQVMTATLILGGNAFPISSFPEAARAIILASAAATGWSAVHYAWRGISFFTRMGNEA